jgi:hypothetical protein
VIALALALIQPAAASTGSPPTQARAEMLPETARAALGSPRLAGEGTLRWFGLRVYDAWLWSGARGIDPRAPTELPFALELRYARSLSGAAIAERSAREIERLGHGDPQVRTRWLETMRALFPDVGDGDRILGLHEPGGSTRFFLNGAALGEIPDPGFGPAFFGIWLDPSTAAPDLREALLGPAAR